MEGLLTSWILAPAVLVAVACGLSLLAEWAAGLRLPWTLRPALGLAAMIVLAQFGTLAAATAPWTLGAIAALGLAGWLLGWRGGVLGVSAATGTGVSGAAHPVAWGLAAGAFTFALYALPFFVHGEATWAGYIKLDDTATFMAMADWAFEHGRGAPETALGSFTVTIQDNLGAGYPIGSFVAAALMGWLPGQDIAWTIQPGMALAAAFLAMALYEVGRPVVRRPGVLAAAAVAGTLSALFLGYYLWGGVKELAAAPLIVLGPAIVSALELGGGRPAPGERRGRRGRPAAPGARSKRPSPSLAAGGLLGLVAAALAGALGLGAGIWVVPIFLLLGADLWRRSGGGEAARLAGGAAAIAVLGALPAVFTPAGVFNPLQGGLTSESELGNLAEALNPAQVAGLWPALDFRQDPAAPLLVALLIAVVCFASAWLVWRSWRSGRAALTALALGGFLAAMLTVLVGSPWVGAKALATFSPILLFTGLCGLLSLAEGGRGAGRAVSYALAALIAGTAVWGAAQAYSGISFAPRAHYEELAEIGERFAGQGPALSTEVSVSGPRHFLRQLDANTASGRRAYEVLTRAGEPFPDGEYLDLSQIRPDQFRHFPLIVTRRSPVESRPPSEFELAWQGHYFEVWRQAGEGSQAGEGTQLVRDLRLGDEHDPGAVPECEQVRQLADAAGAGGLLRAAPAGPAPWVADMSEVSLQPGWEILGPDTFSPLGPGKLQAVIDLTSAGPYTLWVGGEIYAGLQAEIDGRPIGQLRGTVNNGGAFEPLGPVDLGPGRHQLQLTYSGPDLQPGSAFQGTWSPFPVGPIILARDTPAAPPLVEIPATAYHRLCGHRWDWIEARARG